MLHNLLKSKFFTIDIKPSMIYGCIHDVLQNREKIILVLIFIYVDNLSHYGKRLGFLSTAFNKWRSRNWLKYERFDFHIVQFCILQTKAKRKKVQYSVLELLQKQINQKYFYQGIWLLGGIQPNSRKHHGNYHEAATVLCLENVSTM